MNQTHVFVYGTLMKNYRNHAYLKDATYIGAGVIEGYDMYDLGRYPGIIAGKGKVFGEVYQVTDEIEKQLDYLEEEGDLYIKKPETIRLENGQTVEGKVYVYNRSVSGCEKIEGKYICHSK